METLIEFKRLKLGITIHIIWLFFENNNCLNDDTLNKSIAEIKNLPTEFLLPDYVCNSMNLYTLENNLRICEFIYNKFGVELFSFRIK